MTTIYFVPNAHTASLICELENVRLQAGETSIADMNSLYESTIIDPCNLKDTILEGETNDNPIFCYRATRHSEEWMFLMVDDEVLKTTDDLADLASEKGMGAVEYLLDNCELEKFTSEEVVSDILEKVQDKLDDAYELYETECSLMNYGRI